MNKIALIGKKIGMTREFYKTGQLVPVTVLKMEKARVIQIIDTEKRGYKAVQLGYGKIKSSKLTKAMKGYFAKKNTEAKKKLKEFRVDNLENFKEGNEFGLEIFKDTNIEPILLILSSDHQIKDMENFHLTIKNSIDVALQDNLVIFGIPPKYPATGYGYIKAEKEFNLSKNDLGLSATLCAAIPLTTAPLIICSLNALKVTLSCKKASVTSQISKGFLKSGLSVPYFNIASL